MVFLHNIVCAGGWCARCRGFPRPSFGLTPAGTGSGLTTVTARTAVSRSGLKDWFAIFHIGTVVPAVHFFGLGRLAIIFPHWFPPGC